MKRFTIVSALVALAFFAGAVFAPVAFRSQAQDEEMMDMGLACDSTLMLLIYVAEHDYDYLSGMRMNMPDAAPIDYGQFTPLIENTVAMMTAMMEEASEEDMMAMEAMNAMVEPMMMMSLQELTDAYLQGMDMDAMDLGMYTELPTGAVEGEDPGCTALREEVTHFLLAHIIAESEMNMMAMEGDM